MPPKSTHRLPLSNDGRNIRKQRRCHCCEEAKCLCDQQKWLKHIRPSYLRGELTVWGDALEEGEASDRFSTDEVRRALCVCVLCVYLCGCLRMCVRAFVCVCVFVWVLASVWRCLCAREADVRAAGPAANPPSLPQRAANQPLDMTDSRLLLGRSLHDLAPSKAGATRARESNWQLQAGATRARRATATKAGATREWCASRTLLPHCPTPPLDALQNENHKLQQEIHKLQQQEIHKLQQTITGLEQGSAYVCMCVCMYACMHVCMHVCM